LPHPPQFWLSLLVSTQADPQTTASPLQSGFSVHPAAVSSIVKSASFDPRCRMDGLSRE
jgi:hypothetical protein